MLTIFHKMKELIMAAMVALGLYAISKPKEEDVTVILPPDNNGGNGAGNGGQNSPVVPSLPSFNIYDISAQLPTHPTDSYSYRVLNDIDLIVVHHSATESGSAQSYANYHVNTNGWPGIAYHYVIDKDGRINLTNDLSVISYHDSGRNARSIGICLTGQYDYQTVPEVQLNAAAYLINQLRYNLGNLTLSYHRDDANKSCPGNNFPYESLENKVQDYFLS